MPLCRQTSSPSTTPAIGTRSISRFSGSGMTSRNRPIKSGVSALGGSSIVTARRRSGGLRRFLLLALLFFAVRRRGGFHAIHQRHQRHRGVVALPEAALQYAQIAAVALGIART